MPDPVALRPKQAKRQLLSPTTPKTTLTSFLVSPQTEPPSFILLFVVRLFRLFFCFFFFFFSFKSCTSSPISISSRIEHRCVCLLNDKTAYLSRHTTEYHPCYQQSLIMRGEVSGGPSSSSDQGDERREPPIQTSMRDHNQSRDSELIDFFSRFAIFTSARPVPSWETVLGSCMVCP
jgi:hypothetical protein